MSARRGRTNRFAILLLPVFLLAGAMPAAAQPTLDFSRIDVVGSEIELFFSAGCDSTPVYGLTEQDIRIEENDVDVPDFTLSCPDSSVRYPMSVALVFDASSTMTASRLTNAKNAGRAFVEEMDGVTDEAAVLWFAQGVTLLQPMTTSKADLMNAMNGLPTSVASTRHLYEGIYQAVTTLIQSGSNDTRAVVVLTDGGDTGSNASIFEIEQLARLHRIHIIGVGLGSQGYHGSLGGLVRRTGGQAHNVADPLDLPALYRDITSFITDDFRECSITYPLECPDGNRRTVQLRLSNFCGSSIEGMQQYYAPLDSSTFVDLHMEISNVEGMGNSDIDVELRLVTPLDTGTMLPPLSLVLRYNPACAEFRGVQPGSALAGTPMQITSHGQGRMAISTSARSQLRDSGPLLKFTFHTAASPGAICCPVHVESASFATGCFTPIVHTRASSSLRLTHLTTDSTIAKAAFRMSDDWRRIPRVLPRDITLTEDGYPITAFNLHAPDSGAEAVSAVLLLDANGTITPEERTACIDAGKAFVGLMDGISDRAAVGWFGSRMDLAQEWTTETDLLRNAVDLMPTRSGAEPWDACAEALQLFTDTMVSRYRSLVVLSSRPDAASSLGMQDIIDSARQRGVHVNVLRLSSGDSALSALAEATGGLARTAADPSELVDAAVELFRAMRSGYGDYILSWRRYTCNDGQTHRVHLELAQACADINQSFQSSVPGEPIAASMQLGSALAFGGNEVTLPLYLDGLVDSLLLTGFSFRVQCDSTYLQLKRVEHSAGSLLDGMTVNIWNDRVWVSGKKLFGGVGPLLDLTIEAAQIQDTLFLPVHITDWEFTTGCLAPEVAPGEVGIYPPGPIPLVSCEMYGPGRLEWDSNSRDYALNPFSVMARFPNFGNVMARNAHFVLTYDDTKLQRVRPPSDTIVYSYADIIPGSHAAVAWDLTTPRRYTDDSTVVSVTALFDNHPPVTCSTSIIIPRADAILECDLSIPQLRVDPSHGRLSPMPFPVRAVVRNVGARDAVNVVAGIVLDDSLTLAGVDAPDRYQKSLIPPTLKPGQSANVEWLVVHPLMQRTVTRTVQVITQSSSTAASSCSADATFPGVDTSSFNFSLILHGDAALCAGDSLVLDASSGRRSYHWNTGDTTRRIVVREEGSYFCVVQLGVRTGYSDTVHVTVTPHPHPRLRAEGALPMCAGDTVTLEAGTGFAGYRWSTGARSPRIAVTTAGQYWVDVTDAGGCEGRSDTLAVQVLPPPAKPVITRSGDVLHAQAEGTLQWYRNGQPLTDETKTFLTLAETGTYTVLVTDSNGCTTFSDPFDAAVLHAADLPASVQSLFVYPNPSDGMFRIDLRLRRSSAGRIRVFDVLGRTVFREDFQASAHVRRDVHLPRGASGYYLLHIALSSGGVMTRGIPVRTTQ